MWVFCCCSGCARQGGSWSCFDLSILLFEEQAVWCSANTKSDTCGCPQKGASRQPCCVPCRLRLENVLAQRVPQQLEEVPDDLALQQRDGLHACC